MVAAPMDRGGPATDTRFIDITRGVLPIASAVAVIFFIAAAAYTTGGVMEGIRLNREVTAEKLSLLQADVDAIKRALIEGGCSLPPKHDPKALIPPHL